MSRNLNCFITQRSIQLLNAERFSLSSEKSRFQDRFLRALAHLMIGETFIGYQCVNDNTLVIRISKSAVKEQMLKFSIDDDPENIEAATSAIFRSWKELKMDNKGLPPSLRDKIEVGGFKLSWDDEFPNIMVISCAKQD